MDSDWSDDDSSVFCTYRRFPETTQPTPGSQIFCESVHSETVHSKYCSSDVGLRATELPDGAFEIPNLDV